MTKTTTIKKGKKRVSERIKERTEKAVKAAKNDKEPECQLNGESDEEDEDFEEQSEELSEESEEEEDKKICGKQGKGIAKPKERKGSKPEKPEKNHDNEKKHHRRPDETFNTYIYKVLKTVQPELGISKKAMKIMNDLTYASLDWIATKAEGSMKKGVGKAVALKTMTQREIQLGFNLLVEGSELYSCGNSEGSKALNKYGNYVGYPQRYYPLLNLPTKKCGKPYKKEWEIARQKALM